MATDSTKQKISFFFNLSEKAFSFQKNEFAVLLDVRRLEINEEFPGKILKLCKSGAKYFVCYEDQAELCHDIVDNIIISDEGLDDIVTTFHENESINEVASFFREIAMLNFKFGVVVSFDKASWKAALR